MTIPEAAPLQQLQCPSCGSPINQFSAASQSVVCKTCGSYVAIGSGTPELLNKAAKLPSAPRPIKIGDRANIAGTDFIVLGRVVYEGWDDEDKWTWHEWQLGGSDGRMIWMSFDENGFSMFQKLRFRSAFNAKIDSMLDLGEGKKAFIKERYPARVVGAEGELSWRAKPGERLFMAEGSGVGKQYSIQQTDEELEVYEGRSISEETLAQAFNSAEWQKDLKNQGNRKSTLIGVGVVCLIAALIGIVFGFGVMSSGELLEPHFFTLTTSQPTATLEVEFNQIGRPAVVEVALRSGSLPENSSVDIDVSVASPDGTQNDLFIQELWHETGTDEDGFWRETQYTSTQMFVPFQIGVHKLALDFDADPNVTSVEVAVSVRRNYIMPEWFFGYGVLCLIIGIIALLSGLNKKTG